MSTRVCPDCRGLYEVPPSRRRPPSRCEACIPKQEAKRKAKRPYHHAERVEHERMVQQWVQVHGYICPGCPVSDGQWHVADRVTNPLTVHHEQRVAAGGQREGGPKRVVCRAGNSALG